MKGWRWGYGIYSFRFDEREDGVSAEEESIRAGELHQKGIFSRISRASRIVILAISSDQDHLTGGIGKDHRRLMLGGVAKHKGTADMGDTVINDGISFEGCDIG